MADNESTERGPSGTGAERTARKVREGIVTSAGMDKTAVVTVTERKPHPRDRRVKVVTITALGEKAKAKAFEQLYEPPPAFINALTQNEQRTLRDLLRKVRDSMS